MAQGYLYDNGDELISREDVLPATTDASSGDVLSLNPDKKPVWSAPSGGGGGSGILIDATGEFSNVSFNEETYSGTPISGSFDDYIDAIESGKTLIIVTKGAGGILKYSYPVLVTPAEAYNMINFGVFSASALGEAYIGYPTDHPNDLYYMISSQA